MAMFGSQKGFTLAELLVTASLTTMLTAAGSVLLRDYYSTARTLRVQAEGNAQLMSFLKNITRDFQSSSTRRRACVLQQVTGNNTDPNPQINSFNCLPNGVLRTDGIGFNINGVQPQFAYINSCMPFNAGQLPLGRGGRQVPPDSPNLLGWGGAQMICPAACANGFRPVVRFLRQGAGLVDARAFPRATPGGNPLELWGAVVCASEFQDVRELQGVKSSDFMAQYINVLAFVARGRFDIRYPQVTNAAGNLVNQTYVWMTGGVILDFLDSQEMAIFKCPVGQPNCTLP